LGFFLNSFRFFAFGRVFSGTVSCQRVRVMGANYTWGEKTDLAENANIQRVVIMMADKTPSVESVSCGSTCALVGIDNYLAKSGTVVSEEHSHPLVNMKYRFF
jgi:elongation factor 2